MPVYTHKHTHTRILKPFEDRELTGLKVDITSLAMEANGILQPTEVSSLAVCKGRVLSTRSIVLATSTLGKRAQLLRRK